MAEKNIRAFTLIELLIVVAIIAVLGSATVVVLNPVEIMKNSRDSTRTSDLDSVKKATDLYDFEFSSYSSVLPNVVYTSLPDTSSACSSYSLPALPSGWTYNCVNAANLQKTDGTGWIPISFNSMSKGSPIPALPVDPVNSVDVFYTFAVSSFGNFEFDAVNESQKQYPVASRDGGDDGSLFERGTALAAMPYLNRRISMKTPFSDPASVRIALVDYRNCGSNDVPAQLTRLGFTNYVDITSTANTVADVIAYNPKIIIASQGCWGVSKPALLNSLYDLGYSIYSEGNDTTNNISPIATVVGTIFVSGNINQVGYHPTQEGWTNQSNLADNGNGILTVKQGAVVIASDNYIESVYLQEPGKGKWFHYQPHVNPSDIFFKNMINYLAR